MVTLTKLDPGQHENARQMFADTWPAVKRRIDRSAFSSSRAYHAAKGRERIRTLEQIRKACR